MKLIVGLGNPGPDYAKTRHNAGFMAVDELIRRDVMAGPTRSKFNAAVVEARVGGEKCLLVKPMAYMNRSGLPVQEHLRFYKLEAGADLMVIVDDLALPVGHVRVRAKGGSGGHNGLKDLDRVLAGAVYARCRVGIGKVPPGWKQEDWVLSRFADEESVDLGRSVKEAADAAEFWVREGVEAAMNRFNARLEDEKNPPKKKRAAPPSREEKATEGGKDDVHPGWTGVGE